MTFREYNCITITVWYHSINYKSKINPLTTSVKYETEIFVFWTPQSQIPTREKITMKPNKTYTINKAHNLIELLFYERSLF